MQDRYQQQFEEGHLEATRGLESGVGLNLQELQRLQKSPKPTAVGIAAASKFGSGMKTLTSKGKPRSDCWGKLDGYVVQ